MPPRAVPWDVSVVAYKAADPKVRITHPERVIAPSSGLTKRDLAEYYAQVSPWLLPHLKDRPIALVRAPERITGELFFLKMTASPSRISRRCRKQARARCGNQQC